MNVIVVGEKLAEKGACPALRYIRSNGGGKPTFASAARINRTSSKLTEIGLQE